MEQILAKSAPPTLDRIPVAPTFGVAFDAGVTIHARPASYNWEAFHHEHEE